MMALQWQCIEDVMHRMNFSHAPEKQEETSNPLLLYFASGVCALWLIKTILVHIGL